MAPYYSWSGKNFLSSGGPEGGSSTLEDEEFSEYENHVSFNSDSDSELEQEDEIDPQPAHQQPAGGGIWMVK